MYMYQRYYFKAETVPNVKLRLKPYSCIVNLWKQEFRLQILRKTSPPGEQIIIKKNYVAFTSSLKAKQIILVLFYTCFSAVNLDKLVGKIIFPVLSE